MSTVAQVIAESFRSAGITRVFGLPGGETVELLDELRLQEIDFILVKNESSAVFMADSYAQITRRPAVCMTTLGPGAANAVMGVAHCYLDRTPVVIITAQKPDSQLVGYTHQVIDLHALFAPITKASIKVTSSNAGQVVSQALALATTGRPGPVHLQLASDVAAEPSEGPAVTHNADTTEHEMPPEAEIMAAQALLAESKRPLIMAGLGMEPQAPYAQLANLAEILQAPVITTPKAKGALPYDHPLCAGVIGLARNESILELVVESDCVIAVGFDVVELVRKWDYSGDLIWVAGWLNEDPRLSSKCELVGDMAKILERLATVTPVTTEEWGVPRLIRYASEHQAPDVVSPAPGHMTPQATLRILREATEQDAYLAVDVGAHKIYSSDEWAAYTPNRFLLSNGLSSMSYALPAAIGAVEAEPDAQVICLTGDAGLAMNMGELGVLSERHLPVVVILLNDGAIDLIRSHQRSAGKPIFGTEFSPPHYARIAEAFGIDARRVGSDSEFANALQEALARRQPALIEVMLDPTSYPTTPKS